MFKFVLFLFLLSIPVSSVAANNINVTVDKTATKIIRVVIPGQQGPPGVTLTASQIVSAMQGAFPELNWIVCGSNAANTTALLIAAGIPSGNIQLCGSTNTGGVYAGILYTDSSGYILTDNSGNAWGTQ